jgi:putative flippase GtrA
MNKLKIEVTKYTFVGMANFFLTLLVFTVLLKILAVNYLFSLFCAWLAGVFFSYVLNFSWVFKPEQKIQYKERFAKFFIASVVSIVLNMLALRYAVQLTSLDPFFAQLLLMPFFILFNFATAKFWSLKSVEQLGN